MSEFTYKDPFPVSDQDTEYKRISEEFVSVEKWNDREFLIVEPEAITFLARRAMRDVSFLLRPAHLKQVAGILDDPHATPNDRGVALALLRNAEIAAGGVLPLCQDTGTAVVMAKKGEQVLTGGNDAKAISRGIYDTYTAENLRYSQTLALSMYKEKNSGSNLPAQIEIYAVPGDEYKFLFLAKGGGSANKTYLYQETKALLSPEALIDFLTEKMKTLGTAACPPYHLAFAIGGTSAEMNLKVVKLASAHYLDSLPVEGDDSGSAFRDPALEQALLERAKNTGIGAQFGGKYFALDVRVIRLPRHGASCPIGMGVSCSADRNITAKINREGLWLEALEENPGRFIPEEYRQGHDHGVVKIDLNQPMPAILAELSRHPVATQVSLTGTLIVARDIAHARIKERLDRGEPMPEYMKKYPVYYAGPAKTPEGYASGSFGPTTANRMDPYVDPFQAQGGSMIMIAKGNRSKAVTDACKRHGGFYLGSIGGPAALLAKENIKKVELVEYPELGMEAIYKIQVKDFPAFILVDDKGNDFFAQI